MKYVALMLGVALTAQAWGDIVHLRDGSKIEGEVKRIEGGWEIKDAAGKTQFIEAAKVTSIELKKSGSPPSSDEASMRLYSLRKSVEALEDLNVIISRYDRFIEQNANTPAGKEAEKERDEWRVRQAGGMVKVGAKWVTPAERDAMKQQAAGIAAEAVELIRQARLKDADAMLQKALADDPANVPANFLRGVLQFSQNQVPAARKSFEAVHEALPGHGPTLNNLAVIAWRQNQIAAALNFYDSAMKVSPNSREILANVAEALNSVPNDIRNNPITARATRQFQQQDSQLQAEMAQKGLYRWGATWVNKQELDRLQAAEAQVRREMQAMEQEFTTLKDRIDRINQDIEENERAMRQLEAAQLMRNEDGQLVRTRLPRVYYEMQEDNERLKRDRGLVLRDIESLRADAKKVEAKLPAPPYAGVQQIIGVEGTPMLEEGAKLPPPPPHTSGAPASGPGASTRPSTAPRGGTMDDVEKKLLDDLFK